jgi:hypothetical protein
MKSNDLKRQISRVERAIALIQSGAVTPMGEGRWHVQSGAQSTGYIVTQTECPCYDSERGNVCKHRWACVGADAALLIGDIERAQNTDELERAGHNRATAMHTLPEAFYQVARRLYSVRRCELSSKTRREEEAAAILIKPQPKSNGRVGAIEF